MTIDEAIIKHIQIADSYHKAMPNYDEAADHRQLSEWLTELKEAKRLLRLAVDGLNRKMPCNNNTYAPDSCDICMKQGNCDYANSFSWKHTNEALKLLEKG